MVQARHHLGLTEREKKFTKELKPYHNSSSPSSSSLVNALKHSYKSIGSVCIFLLLSTLSCSVKTFSCELWYLRCSVVGSHSIAMYELLEPNSCSLHFITHPWQNLIRKQGKKQVSISALTSVHIKRVRFKRKCMDLPQGQRKLSVIKGCPY